MADSRLSGSHVRRIEGHVPGWRRGASAAAVACIVAGVVLVALAYVLASPPSGLCQMSYSKPRYARTILPSSATIDRLPSTYALYTYTDGFAQYTMSPESDSLTIIVFFPGNVGSYKQYRSIASRIIRYIPEGMLRDAVEHYTFDFGEEFSALSALSLQSQVEFASATLTALVQSRITALDIDRSTVSVILIGHSMGGSVATALFMMPDFPAELVSAIYILGSPLRAPVLTTEFALHDFYHAHRRFWTSATATGGSPVLQDILCVSVSGGTGDLMVESSLSDMTGIFNGRHSISVEASQIPDVDVPVEHQVLVWCSELVEVISNSVLTMIDLDAESPHDRVLRRGRLASAELSRFSYRWHRTLRNVVERQLSASLASPASDTSNFDLTMSSCIIFSNVRHASVEVCKQGVCNAVSGFPEADFRDSRSGRRYVAFLLSEHLLGFDEILFMVPPFNRTASWEPRVWGTFHRTSLPVHRHWGSFVVDTTSIVLVAIDNPLRTDLFCEVAIHVLQCETKKHDAPIHAVGLISSDNRGLHQGAVVHEGADKAVRFYRTATDTSKIIAMFSLDPQCRYKLSMQPQTVRSSLSTLFHDFPIVPQLFIAFLFALLSFQTIFVHWYMLQRDPKRGFWLREIVLRNSFRIACADMVVAIILPTILDFRIPDRGPASSIPIPTTQSVWALLSSCTAAVALFDAILDYVSRFTLSYANKWELVPSRRQTILVSVFCASFPLYFLVSPGLYSVIAVATATLDFLVLSGHDLVAPRALRATWLLVHFGLLQSCIPRWSAYTIPNPLSSVSNLFAFIVFLLTNWTFIIGPAILSPFAFHWTVPGCMATFSLTVLTWAPRSIAIFPAVTVSIWCFAAALYAARDYGRRAHNE
ncbi:unnamed protein product (mitochondrion) [Plasmodiophora brassicae]|uniref:GPI inositol-deacylase n=1 Tax=Plasmodiophora brassicae TaxID=37360 RepID=A0A0G4J5M8_PLABS|nr:hypothetical protein PBRA_002837 [Plasmodiophora brassicae]SPQ94975.1 unnamed protein product [Plasmodiophora brassicae]